MTRRPATLSLMPWMQVALRTGEMLMASSVVIPMRLGQMAAAGANPSPRDQKEFARMAPEKLQAGTESLFAMAAGLQQMQMRWLMQLWQPWFGARAHPGHGAQWARLASSGIAPIHRAATANAKRLTRAKTRIGAAKR